MTQPIITKKENNRLFLKFKKTALKHEILVIKGNKIQLADVIKIVDKSMYLKEKDYKKRTLTPAMIGQVLVHYELLIF